MMLKLLGGYLGAVPFVPTVSTDAANAAPPQAKGQKVAPFSVTTVRAEEQGETLQKLTLADGSGDWQGELVVRMKERRQLLLEGFPLTEVARLCLAQHFRWSIFSGPSPNGRTLLLLKPGTPPAPLAERPKPKPSSGD